MIARRHLLKFLIGVAICLAAFLVYRSLGRYTVDEIEESVRSIAGLRLATAFFFVILSYLCLGGFDALAVRYAGKPLLLRQTSLASFTALSIGHNVGLSALSSGAVRYRFYTRWGLTGEDIAKVIVFCGVTVGLGLGTLAGLALLLQPGDTVDLLGLDRTARLTVGLLCLAGPATHLMVCAFVRRPLVVRSWRFEPPAIQLALGQVAIGTLNFACVAASIQQLLASFTDAGYLDVASAYVTANLAALISHVPGGLGVLEATMLGILPTSASIGALVAFRVLYFFVPLTVGVPMLLVTEAYYRHRGGRFLEQTVM
ncbi:putative bifunctional lysylphosphatidylglycerol flippase/synthetase [Neorhizobium galegae]|uniref:Low PH-induced protein A n=1 Tax=Neorhizobium galegae bv. orientalis str. HAMBI 540 TaxID=1028800 RepID=A0A068SUU0_NEOGA|nr:lysylphosphatidylglycerol synthase domain-containing protein [Neorhizobium galegae]CDN49521.1 Low PH-induced protein A [Neorhizobium galegae bv. orientalis str. HAMBI 540]